MAKEPQDHCLKPKTLQDFVLTFRMQRSGLSSLLFDGVAQKIFSASVKLFVGDNH